MDDCHPFEVYFVQNRKILLRFLVTYIRSGFLKLTSDPKIDDSSNPIRQGVIVAA
jgi:hypothetical protein